MYAPRGWNNRSVENNARWASQLVFFTEYYLGNKIPEVKLGRINSMHGRKKKCVLHITWQILKNKTAW
jgi:hypothetical protein